MSNKSSNTGLSLTSVLFIVFLVLKLTNNIDWSWWWVTSPFWIPILLVLGLLTLSFFIVITFLILGYSLEDITQKFKKYKKN
jgi:Zn-dependent protease with chaperone function